MRINNNITAMNAHRQYGINNAGIGKNVEKLSSGYRINRAGDDAAGLAISEKMRGQIRGLQMASKNSQDAISLVQTAEGALQETHNILQRMRELAVQSSSDTNEQTIDRAALQQEFTQLKKEINDIANKTVFNDQNLIDGSFAAQTLKSGEATDLQGVGMTVNIGNSRVGTYGFDIIAKAEVAGVAGVAYDDPVINKSSINDSRISKDDTKVDLGATSGSAKSALLNGNYEVTVKEANFAEKTVTFQAIGDNGLSFEKTISIEKSLDEDDTLVIDFGDDAFTVTYTLADAIGGDGTDAQAASVYEAMSSIFGGETETGKVDGMRFTIEGGVDEVEEKLAFYATSTGGGEDVKLEVGMTQISFDNGLTINFEAITEASLDTEFDDIAEGTTLTDNGTANTSLGKIFGAAASTIEVMSIKNKAMIIQTGSNQGDELGINIDRMDAVFLGIQGANINTQKSASRAITQVNDALNQVSTQRAALGALQNRLDHKIANLDTSAENLQAAESRIRDVDMAKEMTQFMRNQILSQSSTAMLAQANALPQGVLQLLG